VNQWVFYALVIALIGTGWDAWDWWQVRKRTIRACIHRWEYRSLDYLGVKWSRYCTDCPHYEKCELDQVPEAERVREEDKRCKNRG